jgi:LEA14-like dessication related protein
MKSKKGFNKILLGAGLLLGGVYVFRKFNTVNQIKIFLTGFSFQIKDFINSTLNLTVRAINPGLMPVKIESISGEIFVNGNKLGDLFYLQTVNIASRSELVINIPVNVNNFTAGSELINFLSVVKKPQIKIIGKLNAKNISIPFESVLN